MVKQPTDKVVLKGTGSVTAKAGVTFDFAEGSEVVEYAKKFVGNPYVYGGTSLTKVRIVQGLCIPFIRILA